MSYATFFQILGAIFLIGGSLFKMFLDAEHRHTRIETIEEMRKEKPFIPQPQVALEPEEETVKPKRPPQKRKAATVNKNMGPHRATGGGGVLPY